MSALTRATWTPWTGAVTGAAAELIDHQVGSNFTYWRCEASGPAPIAALGLACALLAIAGALVSWRSRRAWPDEATRVDMRAFAAFLGAATGALVCLAIVFQTLASFFLPPCFR
jgi:hypothetical protein